MGIILFRSFLRQLKSRSSPCTWGLSRLLCQQCPCTSGLPHAHGDYPRRFSVNSRSVLSSPCTWGLSGLSVDHTSHGAVFPMHMGIIPIICPALVPLPPSSPCTWGLSAQRTGRDDLTLRLPHAHGDYPGAIILPLKLAIVFPMHMGIILFHEN